MTVRKTMYRKSVVSINEYREKLLIEAREVSGCRTDANAIFAVLEQYLHGPQNIQDIINEFEGFLADAKHERYLDIRKTKYLTDKIKEIRRKDRYRLQRIKHTMTKCLKMIDVADDELKNTAKERKDNTVKECEELAEKARKAKAVKKRKVSPVNKIKV